MTTGIVVGKFYPPHAGHKYLIDFGRARVDRLIVLLCVHQDQVISGELREAWLREIHSDCEIVAVPDTLPEDPVLWANFTVLHLGEAPDVVFSSEEYGAPYAKAMGAVHVMVDLKRNHVPISATKIRANPIANLHFLAPCVRAYFVPRVVFVGAESTGKTTLSQRLAKDLGSLWVPEYGREFTIEKLAAAGFSSFLEADEADLPKWTSEEFAIIARRQNELEDEAARTSSPALFCDTDAFATGIWHERYMGASNAEVEALAKSKRNRLYILCEPDFPFVQDGIRDGESIRDWMHQRFLQEMLARDFTFAIVSGSVENRIGQVTTALAKFTGRDQFWY